MGSEDAGDLEITMFDIVSDPAVVDAFPRFQPTGWPGQFHKLNKHNLVVEVVAQAPGPPGHINDPEDARTLYWWVTNAVDPDQGVMKQVHDSDLDRTLNEMEVIAWVANGASSLIEDSLPRQITSDGRSTRGSTNQE